MKMWNSLLDIIFPRKGEDAALDSLTPEHFNSLISISEPIRDMRAVLPYSNRIVRASIHALKYKKRTEIADVLGQVLHTALMEDISDIATFHTGNILIVPIPLSDARMKSRGYNQAELLARALAKTDGFPPVSLLLERTKDTPSQTTREGKKARIENLKNAFTVPNKDVLRGKAIILIDDVVTTGATMLEAKETLLKAGASRVYGVAVAH